MPWFTDALRVVGVVGGAALVATGVASPLGGALIGAAATGIGNGAADEIEKNQAKSKADQEAQRQKQEAEAALNQQLAEAARRAREAQDRIDAELRRARLPGQVIDCCRNGQIDQIPGLLGQMTNDQFNALGLAPIAECSTADLQQRVLAMIEADRTRRGL